MRFSSLLCLYLLRQTTAAPIALAFYKGTLTHADWVNLDHRRLRLLSDDSNDNNIRAVTDVDSRDTTTLLQSPFHLLSNHDCNFPTCVSSTTLRKSLRRRTDAGKMAVSRLPCALWAVLGFAFAFLIMRLVNRHGRYVRIPGAGHDRATDAVVTKPEPSRVAADEEVSDDFDDTDYPMG
ncbi:uncharacterized protein LDX57_012028 [Aspergillus melleus]|uniref:uncharacterized protein n=1 Tax=Aspergillus melleus TaxID=138277 RepID=UPI001E8E3C2A|nr:uncharacterized protein LDX57_012028 [Aspergillus melleus]KAH8434380.1 hypothetical protein LDX57_012028 [Aspergillus melleus]